MASSASDDIRKIGFNDHVQVDGRALHIQTEVLQRGGYVMRTTVLEGGTVQFATSEPCPDEARDHERIRALVQSQHEAYVGKVIRGEVG
jgi:hypothetical protein